MLVRGHISHIHFTELETKRGPTTLTSVWIVDHHDYITSTKQSSTLHEVQFLDDKQHRWSEALDSFADGDRVLAVVRDDIEIDSSRSVDGEIRAYIKARGLDLARSALDNARQNRM